MLMGPLCLILVYVEHSFGCRRIPVTYTPAIGLVEDGKITQIYSDSDCRCKIIIL